MCRTRVVVAGVSVGVPDDFVLVPTFEFAGCATGERELPFNAVARLEGFEHQQRFGIGPLHKAEHGTIEQVAPCAFVAVERLREQTQLLAVALVRPPAQHRRGELRGEHFHLSQAKCWGLAWSIGVADRMECHTGLFGIPDHDSDPLGDQSAA